MVNAFFSWLVGLILKVLLDRAEKEAKEAAKKLARDKELKEIKEENLKKYEGAKDRASRIKAAEDLLNRTRTP